MSMMNWSLSASARSCAIAGVAASAAAHVEQRAEGLVHRDEGRRHAGRGLEELAAVEALLAAEFVGHGEQPRLDLLLLFALRGGVYSSLDTIWVGIGVLMRSISAGMSAASSSSVSMPLMDSLPSPDCFSPMLPGV